MSDIKLGNNNVTFKVGSTDVDAIYLGDTLIYGGGSPTSLNYLAFRAKEDGQFKFNYSGMSYSLNSGRTWNELSANTYTPTVQSGHTILWKSTITPRSYYGIGTFSSTGQFEVEGDAMSLLYGDNFSGQTALTGNYALNSLFYGCTGLTNAANMILSADTLTNNCYQDMFSGCTSLTTAPALPATTLAQYCYSDMFANCSSLTTAPSILPATTLSIGCYRSMFYECSALRTAPVLPADVLFDNCYEGMFFGCSALNSITCLATDISASDCTHNWVRSVSYIGTFYKASTMNDWGAGADGVPAGWTLRDYSS